jgi:methylmalonyl-CoA/ethylmalonyl-CoA epimerase
MMARNAHTLESQHHGIAYSTCSRGGTRCVASPSKPSADRPCALRSPATMRDSLPSPADRLYGMFDRIDHVGVAVQEIDASLEMYRNLFKVDVAHREIVREQGVEVALIAVGDNHVELLAPLSADTPVGKFLAQRGPGLHHIAYQVSDIDLTLTALKEAGTALIDKQPRVGIRESRVAFLHPYATGGVLTEIVQP